MKPILLTVLLATLAGCVQVPTQTTEVVDDRPGLSFEFVDPAARDLELVVDGIAYGPVSQYQVGRSQLRLVDGTHHVQLLRGGAPAFTEKLYLGAGVDRTLKVQLDD